MSRRRLEFPRKVQAAAFDRAAGHCEKCGGKLFTGKFAYDHVLPDVLGGEPTLANCEVLCEPCHKAKTADDVRRVRKADRQRDKHIGAMKKSRRPMPFGKSSRLKRKINGEVVPR